jgi:hypothetical protein
MATSRCSWRRSASSSASDDLGDDPVGEAVLTGGRVGSDQPVCLGKLKVGSHGSHRRGGRGGEQGQVDALAGGRRRLETLPGGRRQLSDPAAHDVAHRLGHGLGPTSASRQVPGDLYSEEGVAAGACLHRRDELVGRL